jgi:hypothetical protein
MRTLQQPPTALTTEALTTLGEILALSSEEAELIRLSRWSRQPIDGANSIMACMPELPMRTAVGSRLRSHKVRAAQDLRKVRKTPKRQQEFR